MIHDTQSAQISQKQDGRNIHVQSWKQCALPVITAMALWQVMPWTHVVHDAHHVPKCMTCHKAILGITRGAHCFHDWIYIYIYKYIYIHIHICIYNLKGLLYLTLLDWRMKELSLLYRRFLETFVLFHFPSAFIFITESF